MEKRPWAPIIAAPPAHHSSVGVPYWLVKFGIGSWSLIGIGIVISAIVLILGSVYQVFLGVFLAFVLTAVLLPAVNWLSHFMPRALATAVAVISGFALFGGLIAYVVSSILHEWNDLARQFSHGVDNIMRLLTDGSLPFTLERSQVFDVLSKALQQGTQYAQNHAGEIAQTVASNASQVAIILTILALAVLSPSSSLLLAHQCGHGSLLSSRRANKNA